MHVLFKERHSHRRCLASYELEQAIPSYADNRLEPQHGFTVTPSLPDHGPHDPGQLRELKLVLAGYN